MDHHAKKDMFLNAKNSFILRLSAVAQASYIPSFLPIELNRTV